MAYVLKTGFLRTKPPCYGMQPDRGVGGVVRNLLFDFTCYAICFYLFTEKGIETSVFTECLFGSGDSRHYRTDRDVKTLRNLFVLKPITK